MSGQTVVIREYGCATWLRARGYTFEGELIYDRVSGQRPISVTEIQEAACAVFSVSVADLKSERRTRDLAWPRQAAMALALEVTHRSPAAIGRCFGHRDRTTVLFAAEQVPAHCAVDGEYADNVALLRARVMQSAGLT